MKLSEIVESYVMSVKKSTALLPVFKNPTDEELKQIMHHGVIKCVITSEAVYAFDYTNINFNDVPQLKGLQAIIYFISDNSIDVQLKSDKLTKNNHNIIRNNPYIQKYKIHKLISDET